MSIEKTYGSPADHFDLLFDRGYLSETFKTGTVVGSWLREFTQQYEQIRGAAIVDDEEKRFTMEIAGKFNGNLEKMYFTFRYKFDPDTDSLSLWKLHARLGKESKTFSLEKSSDLPPAEFVHHYLRISPSREDDKTMYMRMLYQFFKERNPANDHKEEPKPGKRFWTPH